MRGFTPACNAAVDLGLEEPPVVMEAKPSSRFLYKGIREAVGQLYEYRYFKVADAGSFLILLTDAEVPEAWLDYLEKDRQIGVVWRNGTEFSCSALAEQALYRP